MLRGRIITSSSLFSLSLSLSFSLRPPLFISPPVPSCPEMDKFRSSSDLAYFTSLAIIHRVNTAVTVYIFIYRSIYIYMYIRVYPRSDCRDNWHCSPALRKWTWRRSCLENQRDNSLSAERCICTYFRSHVRYLESSRQSFRKQKAKSKHPEFNCASPHSVKKITQVLSTIIRRSEFIKRFTRSMKS